MLILAVLLFLSVFALSCALLLFPGLASAGAAWLGRRWRALAGAVAGTGRGVARRGGHLDRHARAAVSGTGGFLRRHRGVLAVALALLVLPPLAILLARRHVALEDFRDEDMAESTSMIAQLLRGERLVPPAPPPPAVFTGEDVRRLHPEVVDADRRWDSIDDEVRQRVLAIYEVMRRQYGYEMVLVEGYRSPERQAELMGGGQATRAGAWQSCHQYGLAVDSAPLRDGKLQWDMADPWTRRAYFLYGELAQQAGLDWGGSWRSLKDYVHVEHAGRCRSARAARRAGASG